MSRLRPNLELQLLAELPLATQAPKINQTGRSHYKSAFRAAGLLATFSGLAIQTPSAWALDFNWGTAPFVWTTGNQTETYQVGGVTFTFQQVDPSSVNANANRPTNGNTLTGANPNIPITGGLARGNVLLGIDSPSLAESLQLVMDATNAAGDRVPLDNATYTIIDIDRSCNRGDDVGVNLDEILWQDVVATRGLLGGATGTPVTPSLVGVTPVAGASGVDNSLSETVENITGLPGASFTPDPGSVVFRGITDPTPETLVSANGNDGCNDTLADNDDNRGVEASNNNGQPPNRAEGNASLVIDNGFVDRIEFEFGNGVANGALNGLSETLTANPSGHGIGVFGDLSLSPAIVGISETSTAPVLQTTGPAAGQHLVTYTLRVTNPGETVLDNITVENDLLTTFGSAAGFSVVPGSIVGALPGETFNGGDTTDISGGAIVADNIISLAGGPLAAGGQRDITFEVLIDSAVAGNGPFSNQSIVRANPVNSTTGVADTSLIVRDRSSNANDVASLEPDADQDDPDDGTAIGASFANPFNAAPTTIPRNAGDNDPSNNDSPTVVVITPTPAIGVTKQVVGLPVPAGPGVFDVTYRQIVRNQGTVPLSAVQLTEDLAATFRDGAANGVTSFVVQPGINSPLANPIAGATNYKQLFPNTAFNGTAVQTMLDAANVANSLAPGEFGVVDFVVRVTPGVNLGDGPDATDPPYDGQVAATGTFVPGGGAADVPVSDLSDDRTLFGDGVQELPNDLNADGDTTDGPGNVDGAAGPATTVNPPNVTLPGANEGTENDPTPVGFAQPAIALSKRVTNVTANPDGTFDVTYRQLVQNIGSVALDNVQIAENTSIADTFRVGQPNGATSAVVQSVNPVDPTIVSPGDANGVSLTAGTPGALSGPNRTLLSGTDTLLPNQFGAVDYVVRVTPGNNTEGYGGNDLPFVAQATATGTATSIGGTIVTDPSDDGVEFPNGAPGAASVLQTLDPDDDNNADEGVDTLEPIDDNGNTATNQTAQASENNPTPVRFPKLAISKNISDVTGSGTTADPYIVNYDVTVENVGGIRLNGVQVTEENIDAVFDDLPPGNTTVLGPVTFVGGTPATVNPGFDGEATPQLIDPNSLLTLDPTQSTTLRYQVQVVNPTDERPYDSSSTASGSGIPSDANGPVAGNPLQVQGDANADGTLEPVAVTGVLPVSDLSFDGVNPDPIDNDGNRGSGPGEDVPTVVTFPLGPEIGLTKQVISTVPVPGQPGSFDVTFEYRVQNVGVVPLNGVDITDNYDTQFDIGQPSAVTNYEVRSVTPGAPETLGGPTLSGNNAIVGSAPNSGNLSVAPGNATVFAPGQAATTRVVVRVTPQADQLATVYDGTATAIGTQSNATVVPAPTDTDISDDIPPFGATDPRLISADPGILGEGTPGQSAGDATPVVFDLTTSLQLFKTITATSRGETFTAQLPGAPAGVVGTTRVPDELQSGDTVEYTLYYFNGGSTAFPGLEICDPLPSPLTAIPPVAGGVLLPSLTPLPLADGTGRSCPNGTSGNQGAVVFNIGDVAPGALGSVVFNAQIP